ncbi:MAG: bifunctional diaminohydroxyphosphoribosylaminopyrimidine deaminase/5-amino-6-(5-phosphoribosylamino)uracil reductase RibD [Flavisolibacter sp.]
MTQDELYMNRCIELARRGAGQVAPNPMVGSVLVHDGKIIGEGYHKQFGKPHAEVNCIASVNKEDKSLIHQSTLYVSLEPCAHHGKTPPCADLIIEKKIRKVVVGCRDPFVRVDGKGIEKLQKAGVEVIVGILEKECIELNKRFIVFHTQHRPYIILKWAQTLDGKIARADYRRINISNEYTNRIVHRWRSEEMSILVGTNTVLYDDPELTTRNWPGQNPVRLILDRELKLPSSLKIFGGGPPTLVFNLLRNDLPPGKMNYSVLKDDSVNYYQITEDTEVVHQLLQALYQMNIQSVLVEGGNRLLQSFIDEKLWDEARVITNESLSVGSGLPAPLLSDAIEEKQEKIFSDLICYYKNNKIP